MIEDRAKALEPMHGCEKMATKFKKGRRRSKNSDMCLVYQWKASNVIETLYENLMYTLWIESVEKKDFTPPKNN